MHMHMAMPLLGNDRRQSRQVDIGLSDHHECHQFHIMMICTHPFHLEKLEADLQVDCWTHGTNQEHQLMDFFRTLNEEWIWKQEIKG